MRYPQGLDWIIGALLIRAGFWAAYNKEPKGTIWVTLQASISAASSVGFEPFIVAADRPSSAQVREAQH